MDTNSLLDRYKTEKHLPSERALARALSVTAPALREIRERGLSDERAVHLANDLGLNPGEVLAFIHVERARSPVVKAAWKKVAESMRSAVGLAAMVAVLLPLGTPPKAATADTTTVFKTAALNRSATSP